MVRIELEILFQSQTIFYTYANISVIHHNKFYRFSNYYRLNI